MTSEDDLRDSVVRGVEQAEAGELLDLGSFAEYADEDDEQ